MVRLRSFQQTGRTRSGLLRLLPCMSCHAEIASLDGTLEEPRERRQWLGDQENLIRKQGLGDPNQDRIRPDKQAGQPVIAEREGERGRHPADFRDPVAGLLK